MGNRRLKTIEKSSTKASLFQRCCHPRLPRQNPCCSAGIGHHSSVNYGHRSAPPPPCVAVALEAALRGGGAILSWSLSTWGHGGIWRRYGPGFDPLLQLERAKGWIGNEKKCYSVLWNSACGDFLPSGNLSGCQGCSPPRSAWLLLFSYGQAEPRRSVRFDWLLTTVHGSGWRRRDDRLWSQSDNFLGKRSRSVWIKLSNPWQRSTCF